MFRRIDVPLNVRAIVHLDQRPYRYLGPGVHRFWVGLQRMAVFRHVVDDLKVELRPEEAALVPSRDLRTFVLAPHERALVSERGRPKLWLGPGEHQIWAIGRGRGNGAAASTVQIEVFDTSPIEAEPLSEQVKPLVPEADYGEVLVPAGHVALRWVDGAIDAVLGPGRHAIWKTTRRTRLAVLDMRERAVSVTGQEVMTRDRVSLRLNLSAQYRIDDAERLATVARSAEDALYLTMQLAARKAVATHTLDQLLVDREALAGAIAGGIADRARAIGLEVIEFGLKDVILPGEMKVLLNRVIEAQKEAEANVILRREETAATRSQAQTAKVLAENPLLVRLKELEAYKDLAAKVGQVHVVLGDGVMPTLKLEK